MRRDELVRRSQEISALPSREERVAARLRFIDELEGSDGK